MSDLYIGLVVLGVLVILAVAVYNWWQERALKREAEARFATLNDDVLMEDVVVRKVSKPSNSVPPSHANTQDWENDEYQQQVSPKVVPRGEVEHEFEPPEVESTEVEHEIYLSDTLVDEATTQYEDKASTATAEALVETDDHALHLDTQSAAYDKQSLLNESGLDADKTVDATNAEDEASSTQIELPYGLDEKVDLVAVLHMPQMRGMEPALAFLHATQDLDKRMVVFALANAQDWVQITPQTEADFQTNKIACGIQLADRSGYISKTTLTRFQYEVDKLGGKLAAHVEWLDKGDPWRYASDLDQFCIDVDKLVGFHIIQASSAAFTGTKVRGLAEAGGLVLEADGAFAMNDDAGQRMYCLVNKEGLPFAADSLRSSLVSAMSFQLDIPRVKNCVEVFNQMVLVAKQMEQSLGGILVDDHQKPVGEVQIEKVRQQLKLIHSKMIARGILPGSETALRLFL